MRTSAVLGLIALATTSSSLAASDRAFSPKGATGWNDGSRAILVDAPRGSIELASFGIVEITPEDGPALATLHVRAAIANTGVDPALTVDARTVRLEVPGEAARHPLFVNSDLATLPLAILEPGEHRVVDFYFAVSDPSRLASFDVTAQFATQERKFSAHATFVADATPAPTLEVYRAAGWGARWWCDPSYPWPTFYHHDGPIVPRPPAFVVVRHPREHAHVVR